MVEQEEVFNHCINIMHGKLVLSPKYFNEAISDLTFSFLNQKIACFFAKHAVWRYEESSRTAPTFSFSVCTQKHF